MPDGRSLILSSGATRIADMRLWKLSVPDGSLAWLPTTSRRPIRPSVAAIAGKMVYEDQSISSDILEIDLSADGNEPIPLIASTRHDYGPQYSPSGRLISFISTRSGSPQIWVCDRDGSNPRQLTYFERAYIENPCWSLDDRFVAFSAAPGNQTSIYVADVETGEVTDISTSTSHEKCLGWSRDGEWIYCKSEREGSWWVWKTRPDGDRTLDIMDRDVFRLAESLDGKRLVYSRTDTSGVWTCGLGGEDERCLVNEPGTVVPCGWRESERGLFSFCFQEGVFTLMFRDAVTGADSVVASGQDLVAVNLDVCPRGEAVIVDRFEILGSDLYLVDEIPE
jgi:dipeptidyl aminopeptidase/acylaminoacyl peptidase